MKIMFAYWAGGRALETLAESGHEMTILLSYHCSIQYFDQLKLGTASIPNPHKKEPDQCKSTERSS